jgi:hypothetical protein
MKRYVAALICLMSLTVAAQQPAAPKGPPPPQPTAPNVPVAVMPISPVDLEEGGQPINIRLDVTVTDQAANGGPQPKTLMVILADRAMGRTRAAFEDRSIAIDARPTVADGRIRVNVTLQSEPARWGPPTERDATLNWRNSFSLLLENGKPMLALETMDAVTKRKMSIEVKATLQK